MRKYVVFHLSTLLIAYRLSPNGLVAYTSAYPIILQKELATGCPVPINYNFNRLILFTFLPWFISKKYRHSSMFVIVGRNPRIRLAMACVCKVGRSVNQCVNQREKGWSALLVEITSFMGAALKSLFNKGNTVFSATDTSKTYLLFRTLLLLFYL